MTIKDINKQYQNVEYGNAPENSCRNVDYWNTLLKLADNANYAIRNDDNEPFLTLMDSSIKNIDTTGTVNGKPMHWEESMTELKYLSPEIGKEWLKEVNERFLITAATLAEMANITTNFDVEKLVMSRLAAKLEMCSPCLPEAPLNRDSKFVEQMVCVYKTFTKYELFTGFDFLKKYLIDWEAKASETDYHIPVELELDLINIKANSGIPHVIKQAIEKAKSILILRSHNGEKKELLTPLHPRDAIQIIELVDNETVISYFQLLNNKQKRKVLFETNLIYRKSLRSEVKRWLLDASYAGGYEGFEFGNFVILVQEKQNIIESIAAEMGDESADHIKMYFKHYFDMGGYRLESVKDRIANESVSMSINNIAQTLGYIIPDTKHIHTITESEKADIERGEKVMVQKLEGIRQMEIDYNVKTWNMRVVDVLQTEMQKHPAASEESMIRALSMLRGLEGMSKENIFAVLDPKVDSDIDFVGIGALLGFDTSKPVLSREVTGEIKTAIRMLRLFEPYISFEK